LGASASGGVTAALTIAGGDRQHLAGGCPVRSQGHPAATPPRPRCGDGQKLGPSSRSSVRTRWQRRHAVDLDELMGVSQSRNA
jgi:hypothetical protein